MSIEGEAAHDGLSLHQGVVDAAVPLLKDFPPGNWWKPNFRLSDRHQVSAELGLESAAGNG